MRFHFIHDLMFVIGKSGTEWTFTSCLCDRFTKLMDS